MHVVVAGQGHQDRAGTVHARTTHSGTRSMSRTCAADTVLTRLLGRLERLGLGWVVGGAVVS
ncbi:hypothetical protein [Streptomyces sp. AC154]|uniref:hypothetical protein n=1 Tax=Streptomyces sp. AC154 TaxID=3143184 RepID=UPI003F80A159